MMLLVCAGLVLGAQLEITGDPSSIVFNVDGTRPVEMVAQNGVLNLSGIMVANDCISRNVWSPGCQTSAQFLELT